MTIENKTWCKNEWLAKSEMLTSSRGEESIELLKEHIKEFENNMSDIDRSKDLTLLAELFCKYAHVMGNTHARILFKKGIQHDKSNNQLKSVQAIQTVLSLDAESHEAFEQAILFALENNDLLADGYYETIELMDEISKRVLAKKPEMLSDYPATDILRIAHYNMGYCEFCAKNLASEGQ